MSSGARPRLLIDVTRTVDSGLHSGIQRVVRGLYRGAREAAGSSGPTVHPVRCEGDRWLDLGELPAHPLEAVPAPVRSPPAPAWLVPRAGDLLLLADASWYLDPWPAVDALRAGGGRVAGFVHDLLPLRRPDWFRPGVGGRFHRHLACLLERAGALFVASNYIASQLRALPVPQPVTVLPLASSLGHSAAEAPRPPGEHYLAVATVEPRKNHGLLLDGFEALWARGREDRLVLVGAAGWQHEHLLQRLRQHPERGHRLHWLEGVDDARLRSLYRSAHALLYLSQDEGFGLPVLEARELGCPVIASDIPPLREAGGEWARYIAADDPGALLAALAPGALRPGPGGAPQRSWRAAAAPLVAQCRSAPGSRVALGRSP